MGEGEPRNARRSLPTDMAVTHWHTACGWPLRTFTLCAQGNPRGRLLFLGGRADFFEKYLESIAHWAAQGWDVTGFDWRGQGGSGLSHPGGMCHVASFDEPVADLAGFIVNWQVNTRGPQVAIGHSMGAHVLLRAVAEGRANLDGMVLLSPMIGLRAGPLRGRALDMLASLGRLPALHTRPLWRGQSSPRPGAVTSCPQRHADKLWWKAERPELARGAPTWGWLAAATRSIKVLHSRLRQQPAQTHGLVLWPANDIVVDIRAIKQVLQFLPACDHAEILHAGHELLREADTPRQDCMRRIDAFLAARSAPA